jgi:cell division septation protein DedD
MIRDFSKNELEDAESSQHTELTLGSGSLIVLGCGLLILCSAFFTIGYAVGRRSSQAAETVQAPVTEVKAKSALTGSGTKPGAAGQQPAHSQASATAASGPESSSEGKPALASASQASGQPSASQAHSALADQPPEGIKVQPAIAQVQGWMVQIAAVTHTEDAEVLVGALRKRGYTVTARREVGDNLIHVQTGPFVNRNDANSMRQKLLNDGYNAIVQ